MRLFIVSSGDFDYYLRKMLDSNEWTTPLLSSLKVGERFLLTDHKRAVRGYTFIVNPLTGQEEMISLEGEFTVHSETALIYLGGLGLNFAIVREDNMGYLIESGVGIIKLD